MKKNTTAQHRLIRVLPLLLTNFLICLLLSFSANAADDDTPFFAGKTGSPNVMLLFDNSDSMQDSPYFRADGNTYRPDWTPWRRGVTVNPDCNGDGTADDPCVAEDANGNIIYDHSKYTTTSTELTLPGQTPPNLPGIGATFSTITDFENHQCPAPNNGLLCSDRIYDNQVAWSTFAQWSDFVPYRYWKVRITDQSDNSVQYRSFDNFSAGNGYWQIYGDDIAYNNSHQYAYEIVPGSPGEVTYSDGNHLDRVYDRNFDWSTITDWSYFSTHYRYKILEVTSGTNAGHRGYLYSYNTNYGYWVVRPTGNDSLPDASDYTTRYHILGQDDDNKYASGGNHPDSKMYQAKLALKQFLTSGAIKTTDTDPVTGAITERYLMNIGFATFLQARIPRTYGLYYRKRGISHPDQFSYQYRYYANTSTDVYQPTGCTNGQNPPNSVDFTIWGNSYTNMSVGDTVDRAYGSNCQQQTIRYHITSISCHPSDSLPDQVQIHLSSHINDAPNPALAGVDPDGNPQWGYTRYHWRYYPDNGSHDCTTLAPAPPNSYTGDYYTYTRTTPGQSCYHQCRNHAAYVESPYYETTWQYFWGDLRVTDPTNKGYINKNPAPTDNTIVTPSQGYCSGQGWDCTNPDPEDTSGDGIGDWTLTTTANAKTNVCLHLDSNHNCNRLGDINPAVFDYSYYRYPAMDNDPDHPHGWSYKRTKNPKTSSSWHRDFASPRQWLDDHFIYPYYHYSVSTWNDNDQKSPYFPADNGNDDTNYLGDDQIVFIDLPEYDNTAPDKGDDLAGTNINKALTYLNLSRQEYPRDPRLVWTMAPINKGSLSVSTSTAETGNGTPLAATLADARKYLKSYMEQDPLSLGKCRKNYVILLTDGNETAGGDPVAEAAALQHLVVGGEKYPIKVYVVGFGLDAASQQTLDDIADAGGCSSYIDNNGNSHYAYFANNVDELVSILADDITGDILSGSYGRTKVALTRGGMDTSLGLTLYNAYFDWPTWRGHLEAWSLYSENVYNAGGDLLHRAGEIKIDPGTGEKIGEPHWKDGCGGLYSPSLFNDPDAGCIMAEDYDGGMPPDGPTPRRTLYTTKSDGTRIKFDTDAGNVNDILPLLNIGSDDINGDTFTGDTDDAKTIINFINHPGYDNDKYEATRDGNWPLADIYNSGPVLVTAPRPANCVDTDNDGVLDSNSWNDMLGYCDFAELHKNRDGVLYFGSNGGILQAISAGKPADANSGGREKWGYLPRFILPKLKELKEGHRFTMDLTVLAHEVDTSDGLTGSGWKTMLVAGQRKGGRGYIALDVTDPDDPQPMWEFTDSNLGQTWSRPILARILIDGVKTSVVIFGGGYSVNADEGNRLFILKASDGTILKEITVGSGNNNVPSQVLGVQYLTNNVGTLVDYRTNLEKLPDGTTIDYSARYTLTEVAYFGDTTGDIYRLDGLNTESGGSWSPTLTKLYQPDVAHADRPIYYPLVLTDVRNGTRYTSGGSTIETGCLHRYLAAGTGDEHNPTGTKKSTNAPLIDYVFEIEDDGGSAVSDESKLQWRLSLGLQLPMDEYSFLLKPDGSRLQKNGKNILSSYIYLMDKDTFDAGTGWTLDANGHLINPNGELVAYKDEFYFVKTNGDLVTGTASPTAVANGGSYIQLDTSLWLTDKNNMFFDSADGTLLQDTSLYFYDNDGYWDDGLGTRKQINGADVKIIQAPGEKLLAGIAGYGGQLYFTTYSPKGGCDAGTSYFYGIKSSGCNEKGGSGLLEYDKAGNEFHSSSRRRISLGTGITGGVTLGGGTAYVPQYSPGNAPEINALPVPVGQTRLKYWKQN